MELHDLAFQQAQGKRARLRRCAGFFPLRIGARSAVFDGTSKVAFAELIGHDTRRIAAPRKPFTSAHRAVA
jgi:hypothetical protein